MIKNFIITFFISLIVFLLVMLRVYNFEFIVKNISDAIFVVAIFMFFISLISMTSASDIFKGMQYTFRNLFRKSKSNYKSYFEYLNNEKPKKESIVMVPAFILSIIYIVISLLLAFNIMS